MSAGWSRWVVGDPTLAEPLLEALRAELAPVPCGEAVLQKLESGDLHCQLILYFSPGLHAIACRHGAVPCPKPESSGLSLLLGEDSPIQSQG
ncbi:hypothetical protein [Halopseudomonas maritima]|uniref:hypothetical protein n=1 Tax=Halopseudomonas maritima TaxID=2918528 RepID=UPI001EEACB1E|nr:hypothetical protein [Halopseudomonas maritima]UJJ31147.1 hypothetical protein HV822_15480 [Halopseudomonas maritima]